MNGKKLLALGMFASVLTFQAYCQNKEAKEPTAPGYNTPTFSQLQFRSLGPAFMSGRISDIALHPTDRNTWYLGVGSGSVWKTENAGVTWKPIFDDQSVYSIGTVVVDPLRPETVWVGTGENVGGRHVSFGDGIYRSLDGGKTWENRGLKQTNHISKIVIHPEDSNRLWVAAQGPLWSKGGQRGLYYSKDAGKSWKKVLGDKEWTGVTDIVMHPKRPDVLIAATWQRHRTVAAYMGGGPKTALHRSLDGGQTWTKLSQGLPQEAMGKIGLAISPQDPNVVYAAIELPRRTGAIFRSADGGSSWQKMSDTVSGGTGPHYYQELYASPHEFDRIYLADVWLQVSEDGGKTFRKLEDQQKHSDHHALAFRDDDPNFLLLGSDGGLYESYDVGETWRYMENLPTLQFYKVAVDDAEPFYNVFGGTQDNATQMGPSRTLKNYGISNADWSVVLSGDGHQPATEPGNPNVFYAQWQQGNLHRIDLLTGEKVSIRPQTKAGDPVQRTNWDAPILVSPHKPERIFFGTQRLWMSENRGDSWVALSGDLTRDERRVDLPLMEQQWGWNSNWDVYAMSTYNTIMAIAESPVEEGLIYVGTDDGLIQITEDRGKSWRKMDVSDLPGVPERAFINDIKADRFDKDTVYIALDHHKSGDYKPYLLVSRNRGKSWKSLSKTLPDRHLVWRFLQDHRVPNLFYLGTEFGLFFSADAGQNWVKWDGGLPTISIRDLAIQERENDLILGTFGRGIYVMDDLTPIQEAAKKPELLAEKAYLFQPRDAWWYIEKQPFGFGKYGFQGADKFFADNPPYGAMLHLYLKEDLLTDSQKRQKSEMKAQQKAPFPAWEELDKELTQEIPRLWVLVKDEQGQIIRRMKAPTKKGFHRIAWDLRMGPLTPVARERDVAALERPDRQSSWAAQRAFPGKYSFQLVLDESGKLTPLGDERSISVKRLNEPFVKGKTFAAQKPVIEEVRSLQHAIAATQIEIQTQKQKMNLWRAAIQLSQTNPSAIEQAFHGIAKTIHDIEMDLNGSPSKRELREKALPTVADRLFPVVGVLTQASSGPTPNHLKSLQIAAEQFAKIRGRMTTLLSEDIPKFEKLLDENRVPWTPGRRLPTGAGAAATH